MDECYKLHGYPLNFKSKKKNGVVVSSNMRHRDPRSNPYNLRGDGARERAYHVKGEISRLPDHPHAKEVSVGADCHQGPQTQSCPQTQYEKMINMLENPYYCNILMQSLKKE